MQVNTTGHATVVTASCALALYASLAVAQVGDGIPKRAATTDVEAGSSSTHPSTTFAVGRASLQQRPSLGRPEDRGEDVSKFSSKEVLERLVQSRI